MGLAAEWANRVWAHRSSIFGQGKRSRSSSLLLNTDCYFPSMSGNSFNNTQHDGVSKTRSRSISNLNVFTLVVSSKQLQCPLKLNNTYFWNYRKLIQMSFNAEKPKASIFAILL